MVQDNNQSLVYLLNLYRYETNNSFDRFVWNLGVIMLYCSPNEGTVL